MAERIDALSVLIWAPSLAATRLTSITLRDMHDIGIMI